MKTGRLLVATTNEGKFNEVKHFFDDLPFELLSLADLKKNLVKVVEDQKSLEGNAVKKAAYYAEKTGLLTLADDSGLFVNALDGWPGVKSARIADNDDKRIKQLLEKLKNVPDEERTASFRTAVAIYDPEEKTEFVAWGKTDGTILKKSAKNLRLGWGFNPLFFVPELGKTYGELTIEEKNSVSNRAKALNKIKYYLQNQYGGKHLVVPIGIIVKNGKVLMHQRNDPHNPSVHGKWGFPGGTVELGETVEENLIREVKEEAGYEVEIVQQLLKISVKAFPHDKIECQLYLIKFICKIVSGDGSYRGAEVMSEKWCVPAELLGLDVYPGDEDLYQELVPELNNILMNLKN